MTIFSFIIPLPQIFPGIFGYKIFLYFLIFNIFEICKAQFF